MGLQQVKNEIIQEAEEKASDVISEAEDEAEKIRKEAEEEAEKIRQEIQDETRQEKEALETKKISKARMKAKKRVQQAKAEEINKVFNKFEEHLEDLDQEEKRKFFENAVEKSGFESQNIKASKEFEDVAELDETIEDRGLIVESGDGSKSLNLLFEEIVKEFRSDYRKEVKERLFEN